MKLNIIYKLLLSYTTNPKKRTVHELNLIQYSTLNTGVYLASRPTP
jgi:hypothetical protein